MHKKLNKKLILASSSPRRRELLGQIGAEFWILPARGEERVTKERPEEAVMELALQKAQEVADRIAAGERCEQHMEQGKENRERRNEQGERCEQHNDRETESRGRHIEQEKGCYEQHFEEYLVLGADTVVVCDGMILGKPKDEADAARMLATLSGRTHQVFTGVAFVDVTKEGSRVCQFYQETQVEMYPLTQEEILAYVAGGEPMDKAGSYGAQGQGALLIREIRGDYFNVVGLPVGLIYRKLKEWGIEISGGKNQ